MIERSRLSSRFDVDTLPRLTALVAGAGYGKSTLLGQVGGDHWVIVPITEADTSLAYFAATVVRRLRLTFPRMSGELAMVLETPRRGEPDQTTSRPDALAAAIVAELEAVTSRPTVLALDGLHEIDFADDCVRFVAALCRHASPSLRVVVASRRPVPFPVARLRLADDYAEFGVGELAFELDEIVELLADVEPAGRALELATQIHGLTAGWPAVVAFAVRATLRRGHHLEVADLEAEGLFDYFAEEVLRHEDPDVVELVRLAALLPALPEALLELVAPDLAAIAGRVGGEHARGVVMPGPPNHDGSIYLSPAVRQFVATRDPYDEPTARDLLVRAGGWFEREGRLAEMLDCFVRAGDRDRLITALDARGREMVSAGLARQLVEAIDMLGDTSGLTSITLLDAEARQMLGDWEAADLSYQVVIPDSGPLPARIAWRVGFVRHMRGDIDAALATYERGELDGDAADVAALLSWQASAHWLRGDAERAQQLAHETLDVARAAGDDTSLASAHTVLAMVAALRGDRSANDAHYLRALEHAERAHDVVQTIRIRSNRGSRFLEEADLEPALAELGLALRLAELTGFELWRAMSMSNRAEALAMRGMLDEAIGDLQQSRSIFRALGSSFEAYPLQHLGDVYATRGDTALARAAYESAIRLAEPHGDLQALVPASAGLARLLIDSDLEAARGWAERATVVDSVLGRVSALLALAEVTAAAGDVDSARSMVIEASATARRRNDRAGLAEALELEAALVADSDAVAAEEALLQAARMWAEIGAPVGSTRVDLARARLLGGSQGAALAGSAGDRFERLGAKGMAADARRLADELTDTPIDAVMLKTLGGFEVVVAGQRVPSTAWQSRVARELVGMLVATWPRPVNREVLLERFWPGDDPAKSSNRLSQALTTIRNVLDPERLHPADHFVHADRDTVGLGGVIIDIDEFVTLANDGQRLLSMGQRDHALGVLAAAEAMYIGEFMEEFPYHDWPISRREEARSIYLDVALHLAEADVSDGDHESAARRFLRMLERDPFDERAHLGVVTAMSDLGRHGTARRLYGVYCSRMDELDVEPSAFPGST